MKHLQHIGVGYNGIDPATMQYVRARPHEVIAVSDEKAEQLIADFPTEWIMLGDADIAPLPEDAPNVRVVNSKPARPSRRKAE